MSYPQRNIGTDKDGWAIDLETNEWIRSDSKSATFYSNSAGWLYTSAKKEWAWPEAWDEPDPNSWNYQARHPTRYTWRDDVEAWARYLVDNYDVWCNTYYDHPEGYWRTETSIDVWGPAGRNDPIDPSVGSQIFSLLFNAEGAPWIDWIIWQETIYGAWNGWNGEYFGDGSEFTAHRDHVHCTYR